MVEVATGTFAAEGPDPVASRRGCGLVCSVQSLESTIAESELSVSKLRDELRELQAQVANVWGSVAACAEAGASAAGNVKEFESEPFSMKNDLPAAQAGRYTARAKESQLPETCKGLLGLVAAFRAELGAAQTKLTNVTTQCHSARGCVLKLPAEPEAAAAGEVTAVENLSWL